MPTRFFDGKADRRGGAYRGDWAPDQSQFETGTSDLGSESLNEGNFATTTKWEVAVGDFAYAAGKATYTHAGGTGSISQLAANQQTAAVGSSYYALTYTISTVSGDVAFQVDNTYANTATSLTMTAGTHTTYFRAAASPTTFTISGTSTSGAASIDDISLIEIQEQTFTLQNYTPGTNEGGTVQLEIVNSGFFEDTTYTGRLRVGFAGTGCTANGDGSDSTISGRYWLIESGTSKVFDVTKYQTLYFRRDQSANCLMQLRERLA